MREMAQRRDQPSVQQPGNSIGLRFPDGTVKTMPVDALRGPATSHVCCFCGESVAEQDGEFTTVSTRWREGRQERHQQWAAHHRCVSDRLHPRVRTGPFFED
jgi:hypothetical protein